MKTEFTPHPWCVDGSLITRGQKVDDEVICDYIPSSEYPTVYERDPNEARKNGVLISYAPELFLSLADMVDLWAEMARIMPVIGNEEKYVRAVELLKIITE